MLRASLTIHLTRPTRKLRTLTDPLPDTFDTRSTSMLIRLRREDGTPLLITRTYIERLRAAGWQPVDLIPDEYIVETPGPAPEDRS